MTKCHSLKSFSWTIVSSLIFIEDIFILLPTTHWLINAFLFAFILYPLKISVFIDQYCTSTSKSTISLSLFLITMLVIFIFRYFFLIDLSEGPPFMYWWPLTHSEMPFDCSPFLLNYCWAMISLSLFLLTLLTKVIFIDFFLIDCSKVLPFMYWWPLIPSEMPFDCSPFLLNSGGAMISLSLLLLTLLVYFIFIDFFLIDFSEVLPFMYWWPLIQSEMPFDYCSFLLNSGGAMTSLYLLLPVFFPKTIFIYWSPQAIFETLTDLCWFLQALSASSETTIFLCWFLRVELKTFPFPDWLLPFFSWKLIFLTWLFTGFSHTFISRCYFIQVTSQGYLSLYVLLQDFSK